jgi:dethiobiotin synthetase/adenosylmethionine--8-amino-7-oxononanoate aminotransferase
MEVALKMAFRKYYADAGLLTDAGAEGENLPPLRVAALNNGYHGDTLGVMDAQAPSVFTGALQTPWYAGRIRNLRTLNK